MAGRVVRAERAGTTERERDERRRAFRQERRELGRADAHSAWPRRRRALRRQLAGPEQLGDRLEGYVLERQGATPPRSR